MSILVIILITTIMNIIDIFNIYSALYLYFLVVIRQEGNCGMGVLIYLLLMMGNRCCPSAVP